MGLAHGSWEQRPTLALEITSQSGYDLAGVDSAKSAKVMRHTEGSGRFEAGVWG